jgi:hypothetical protein
MAKQLEIEILYLKQWTDPTSRETVTSYEVFFSDDRTQRTYDLPLEQIVSKLQKEFPEARIDY